MTDHKPLLQVQALTKAFGTVPVLRGVDLTLYPGEVYGLLGPNGAGKTTLLSILFGLVLPDTGRVVWQGRPVPPGRPEALVGLEGFVDTPAFYPHLSALDNLRVSAWRRGRAVDDGSLRAHLARVGLQHAAERAVGGFSTGMKKRLGIARALLFQPRLLILDEPTSGLDPPGVREMRHLIRELRNQGIAVLFSSHLLAEVEQVADRVGVLHQGRMVQEDTLLALTTPPRVYWYEVDDARWAVAVLQGAAPYAQVVQQQGAALQVRLAPEVTPGEITRLLVQQGLLVHGVRPQRAPLEEVFFRIIGLHDAAALAP